MVASRAHHTILKKLARRKPSNTYWWGKHSTVDLFIEVACFVRDVHNVNYIKSSSSKLVSLRWSTVLSLNFSMVSLVKHSSLFSLKITDQGKTFVTWDRIFSCVRPFYERAVSNLDRSMHISLWAYVAHSSFIEGLHTTKNIASGSNIKKPFSLTLMKRQTIIDLVYVTA